MRFGHVVIAYFVIGTTMWMGGVLDWDDSGIGQVLIEDVDDDDGVDLNEDLIDQIEKNPIKGTADAIAGGLTWSWNILFKLIGYLLWPITVLQSVGAPLEIVALVGGSFSMAFVVSMVRLVRGN